MTDFKLDPEVLLRDEVSGVYPNMRVISYAEVSADRNGDGRIVVVLVYDSSYEPFDDPVAHVSRRAYCASFDGDGKKIGGGSDMIVDTWWNDFAAYNKADQDRRAEKAKKNPPPPEPKIIEDAEEIEDAWECESCGHVYSGDDKGEPTYECGSCGPIDGAGEDARRCTGCNKFAAKSGEFSCPECNAPEEQQTRVFAKPTDQGTLATWTYPGMDRDEYLESVK